MPTNKSTLRKEIERQLRDVNSRITPFNNTEVYEVLNSYRNGLLRIMEICVERNRF